MLLLWDENFVAVSDVHATKFCLSATVTSVHSGSTLKITTVYGPTLASRKDDFFAELLSLKPAANIMWLALGDFNQIFRARDKSNTDINRRRMNKFRATLNSCDLKAIHLQNRRFTWSNGQVAPTMSRIDGAFCNPEWDLNFGSHILHAISFSLSDHCPLLLADDSGPRRPRAFSFENFWTCLPGFREVIADAWAGPTPHRNPAKSYSTSSLRQEPSSKDGARGSSPTLKSSFTWPS